MTNTTPSNKDSSHNHVVPSEVGWQFVPQYYTHVNKSPDRLHCFYNKTSTFIHGTEGEDGTPCYGQQVRILTCPFLSCLLIFFKEIHNKITSIGFEDCKVFIHSVDAQSSANGGIIIQVIGEMSNRNEPWRKFVQTFFLAEQPNGYFVLNDIFRFLKDPESDGSEPEQATTEAEQVSSSPQQQVVPPLSPVRSQPVTLAADIPAPEPVQTASPTPSAAPMEEASPASEPPAAEPHTNGHAQTEQEAESPTAAPVEKSPTPEPEPAPAVESPAPAASPAPPPAPSPAPPPQPPAPAPVAPSQPAPVPAPAVPKTWANLAATNPKKWGSAVAQESRGTSEVPAASSSSPGSGTQTPVSHHAPGARPQQQSREPHSMYVAATNVSNALCFVKVRCCSVTTAMHFSDLL
jgi:Nuclear transport factor 2 (NTF2) domain